MLMAARAAAKGFVRVRIGRTEAAAEVEVAETAFRVVEDFENGREWRSRATEGAEGSVGREPATGRNGSKALRLEYNLAGQAGVRAVYALGEIPLARPLALRCWVYGDGQGAWLRVRVRDATNRAHLLDLARRVDWSRAWKETRLAIPADLPGPLTLEAIYVVETDPAVRPRGSLLLDDLAVDE
jgi:hypothetical protein